jgi:hypothetical protein
MVSFPGYLQRRQRMSPVAVKMSVCLIWRMEEYTDVWTACTRFGMARVLHAVGGILATKKGRIGRTMNLV